MKTYKIKFRKIGSLFWKSRDVIAHIKEQAPDDLVDPNSKLIIQRNLRYIDAIIFEFEDGTIERIPEWSKYEYKLGLDWKEFHRKQMELEAGKKIEL